MDLEYKMKDTALLKSSTGKAKVVRVEFDPPLVGYEEVKPRLLGMKVDADEALGTVRPNHPFASFPFPSFSNPSLPTHVHFSQSISHKLLLTCIQVKSPQITHFELPFQIWTTASLLLLLIYTTSAPLPDSNPPYHHVAKFWWLAHTICPGIVPNWMIPLSWAIVITVHAGEGAYAVTRAYKHRMPWHIAVSLPFHRASVMMHRATACTARRCHA